MNILKIIVALLCAYGLFVAVSYMLMRLIFPKIQTEGTEENLKLVKSRTLKRLNRPLRRQKNLAY